MSATRKLERSLRTKEEHEQLKMAAKAAAVAALAFEGEAPTIAALKIRIAIGLNFVLICKELKMQDLGRALHAARVARAGYNAEKDGPSQMMRWLDDVIEHSALEDAWRAEKKLNDEVSP